jgi:glycolate oxidase
VKERAGGRMQTMRAPRDEKARRCAARIGRRIGGAKVVDDPDATQKYSHDESGERPRMPSAVIFPESASDAAAALRLAAREGVCVTPRAGGTGKSGGAVPVRGGLVLSLERMRSIEEISREDLVAVVRPGTVLQDLHNAVEEQGLFYPPDPASLDSCCLGGNVAENAGGPRAFKYGVTGHYVLSLELATMDGRVVRAGRRPAKQASGPSVVSMMVGSEGTLAVMTLIMLRLVPLPGETATCVATFPSAAKAAAAIGKVLQAGLVPRVMEIMDRACMDLMQEYGSVHFEPAAGSVLLIELDGDGAAVRAQLDRAADILQKEGSGDPVLLSGAVEKNRFWEARRKISEYLKKKYPLKISDDVSVPRGRMVEAIEGIYGIARRRGLESAIYGHAGDGNLHVNLIGEGAADRAVTAEARDEIMRLVLSMDGAVSGEHGIGSLKRRYLRWQQDAGLQGLQKKVKAVFDPAGLLNPGKIY